MIVVRANGSPFAVGHAHGVAARDVIQRQLRRWAVEEERHGRRLDQLIHGLNHEAGFRACAERVTPSLMEEIAGIASGSRCSVEEIFALNCLDEAWWWHGAAGGCSVIGIADLDGVGPVGAQNMDLPGWMAGSQLVLDIAPETSDRLVLLTSAGMIGLCGASSDGLAVLVNTLSDLPVNPDGLPVAFVLRRLLDGSTIDDAVERAKAIPHACGQAYTLLDRAGNVVGVECDASGAARYGADSRTCLHTNHPLARRREAGTQPTGITESSAQRLAIMESAVPAVSTIGELKALLSDDKVGLKVVPGRFGRDDWATFGSIIVTLRQMVVSIAPGSPQDGLEYAEFSLSGDG